MRVRVCARSRTCAHTNAIFAAYIAYICLHADNQQFGLPTKLPL